MDIRTWRKKEGLTLQQLAEKLHTTIVTLSRFETGVRRNYRAKMVEAIFILTNGEVDANDLFNITPERIAEMAALRQELEILFKKDDAEQVEK